MVYDRTFSDGLYSSSWNSQASVIGGQPIQPQTDSPWSLQPSSQSASCVPATVGKSSTPKRVTIVNAVQRRKRADLPAIIGMSIITSDHWIGSVVLYSTDREFYLLLSDRVHNRLTQCGDLILASGGTSYSAFVKGFVASDFARLSVSIRDS